MLVLYAGRVSSSLEVPCIYLIKCTSFFCWYLSGAFTRVLINANAVWMYNLALSEENCVLEEKL